MNKIINKIKSNKSIRNFYVGGYKNFIKTLVKISPVVASKISYRNATGKKLDLENPIDFNEKIQWLKLYWQHPLVSKCTDKYEVREYVTDCGCSEILNELYYVFDNPADIEWGSLPEKFVLKTTHACDTNIICDNISNLNLEETYNKLEKWMKIDNSLYAAEMQYSKIKPRIVCERYLETKQGLLPNDYKLFCFGGEPKFLYVGIIDEVGYTHKTFYDLAWNKLNFQTLNYKSGDHEPPECLDEMIAYAKALSKPFPFVRVDFFDYNGKPIFGEMTFTPTGGQATYYNEETLLLLGDMLKLPKKIKVN